MSAGRLDGKIAIVVGAGQAPGATIGNGRAIALLFAREGARVICADLSFASAEETVGMIAEEGGTALPIAVDVSKSDDVEALVSRAVEHFGRIDILVNNVGIGGGGDGSVDVVKQPAFERIVAVNLTGMMLTTRAVLPTMREQRAGSIVNISSVAADLGAGSVSYEVSKAGVDRLTTSTAQSQAVHNIRCNAVKPGMMDTPMAINAIAAHRGLSEDEVRAQRDAMVPLDQKMGTAWDTAYAALFLASDEARYITGARLAVDGGLTIGLLGSD